MWILTAFIEPISHGISNVLDSYLTNRLFSRKTTLIFYSALLNLAFLPILFLFTGLPELPDKMSLILFVGLALTNVLYSYPYYKALEKDDTSNVVALFSLGEVFVPVLAYFMVGESLAPVQYLGVIIVMFASAALSVKRGAGFKVNSSLWWMVLCGLILSFEYVLYKKIFISTSWITGFTWPIVFSFIIGLSLFAFKATRADIIKNAASFKKNLHLFALEELTTFVGIAGGTYAVSVAPVTIVRAITSTGPAFILVYAYLFREKLPDMFKESTERGAVAKKLVLFAVIGFGLYLTLGNAEF